MRLSLPRRLLCGGMLAGACLLGVAWGGPEQRSDVAVQQAGGANDMDSTVADLVRQLDHPRPSVRREAIVRLAELGGAAAPAVPKLMDHLQDRDLLVRAHAARAACRLGLPPEPVVPILADLLQSEKLQVSGLAALILGDLGPTAREALPALETCLSSTAVILRLHAAEAILKIDQDNSEALNELLGALDSGQSDTRYFAVNALGSAAIENDEAVFALRRALTDGDTNVAAAAGLNLTRLDDPARGPDPRVDEANADVPPPVELAQLIDDLSHMSAQVRQMAAIRLAMTGLAASCASEALHARLDDPNLIVRVHAAQALWSIERNGADLLPVLVDLLEVESLNVGIAAAHVLGRMRTDAQAALPALRERLAASELLDRLMLTETILRINPQERGTLAILIDGLHDPEGDVRYLSAVALGDAPVILHSRIERELAGAQDDRNLRVQAAAAEALAQLQARVTLARHDRAARRRNAASESTVSARPVAAVAPRAVLKQDDVAAPVAAARKAAMEARLAAQEAVHAAAAARAVVNAHKWDDRQLPRADEDPPVAEDIPAIDEVEIAQLAGQEGDELTVDDDPDEGLKKIGQVRASIRMQSGQFPTDVAAAKFASLLVLYQGYGARRGWSDSCFGWEAPAVFYKPLYFEDVNLERYGIHHGCLQPVISFGHFFTRCACLPYKLLVQPPCECIYTLGNERPNNCMPLYCYCRLGCPSYAKWCQKCPCPVYPPCPWDRSENDVCRDDDEDCP